MSEVTTPKPRPKLISEALSQIFADNPGLKEELRAKLDRAKKAKRSRKVKTGSSLEPPESRAWEALNE